jgi:hypothetical protein
VAVRSKALLPRCPCVFELVQDDLQVKASATTSKMTLVSSSRRSLESSLRVTIMQYQFEFDNGRLSCDDVSLVDIESDDRYHSAVHSSS